MKGLCKKIAATALAFLTIVSVLITAVPPEGFNWAMEAEAAESAYTLDDLMHINCDIIENDSRRAYVNAMIRYHILSSKDNYRVQNNLRQGKSIVFFFDGCSDNMDDDKLKNYNNYRLSAVCVVVKLQKGIPTIVFQNEDCSTIPDNPRNRWTNYTKKTYKVDNSYVKFGNYWYSCSDVPTVKDGIYDIRTTNHGGSYAALNTRCNSSGDVIRCYWKSSDFNKYSEGINIHARSGNQSTTSGTPTTFATGYTNGSRNSTGCLLVGGKSAVGEFNKFMATVTGISNARYNKFSEKEKYVDVGLVIVDRYNYKNELKSIYGSDDDHSADAIINEITRYTNDLNVNIAQYGGADYVPSNPSTPSQPSTPSIPEEPEATFNFIGNWATNNLTVSGTQTIKILDGGYYSCGLTISIDGVVYGNLSEDESTHDEDNALYIYELDTTELSDGTHTLTATLHVEGCSPLPSISRTFTTKNAYFKFWDTDGWATPNELTVEGVSKIWFKQDKYGVCVPEESRTCDVNIYIDDEHLTTIYGDEDNFFSYELDTTKYSNGQHKLSAVLRNTNGKEVWISRYFTINNPKIVLWDWNTDNFDETGIIEVWFKESGTTKRLKDVNIYIDGTDAAHCKCTLYFDKNGYVCYDLSAGTLTDGEHTLYAIYRTNSELSGKDIEYRVERKFTVSNGSLVPVITDIRVGNVTAHGYVISCKTEDNSDIQSVSFACRPSSYTDDRIVRYEGIKQDNTWYVYVPTSDFDNTTGKYSTRIFAYDSSGKSYDYIVPINVIADKTLTIDAKYATIVNYNHGKYLKEVTDSSVSSGYTAVFASHNDPSLDYLWRFRLNDNGYYEIYNDKTGNVLTLSEAASGATIICEEAKGSVTKNQEWIISKSYDGRYALSPRSNPKLTLDFRTATSSSVNDAFIFNAYNGTNQRYAIIECEKVDSLTLNLLTASMSVGDSLFIGDSVEVGPSNAYIKTLKYTSDNTSVATVSDDGTITAVGVGTANIRISNTDGGAINSIADADGNTLSAATITISVLDDSVPVTGVVLSSAEKTIAVGETSSVFATVLPANNTENPALTWSSSDENVATVENGMITAVGIGSAEITVNAGGYTSICIVLVVQPITMLEILTQNVSIENKATFASPVVVYPYDTTDIVKWTSSDESVAIVDENGNVTAVGSGSCTITATSGEFGSDFTVEVPMIETTSLVISAEDTALAKGQSIEVAKEVYPANTTEHVIWTSSDESVAIVVDGVVTAVGAGNCVITATSGNCSESFNLTVYVPVDYVTLDTTAIEMKVGNSYTFTATVEPADTTDSIFWFVDEPEGSDPVAVIDENGKLTAKRAGVTTVIVAVGDYYEICEVTVTEVSYDVVPNVNGGASKLYEPWGLRYFAAFNGEDIDKIADRGIAILKDTYYTDGMTGEEFCTTENVHIYLESKGELGFEEASTNNPNGRYYATLTEGIYSYDISAYYYVVPFAVMENGQMIYGTIKKNSMEKILNTNLNLTSITAEEKAICTCILDLKESVAAHYAASGVPGASIDMAIPRGSSQTAAASTTTTTQSGITPNIVAGASRLIEPWGLRYFATYTDSDSIADRGVVILCEKYFDSSYKTEQDKMRLNANSYVFTESDSTLLYDEGSGRYYATVTEGISSKDIADVYYVVPYVVLDNGSYVYGTVKQNSMMKIMNTNLNIASVSETEKEVSRDIIALYEAVQAYYAA